MAGRGLDLPGPDQPQLTEAQIDAVSKVSECTLRSLSSEVSECIFFWQHQFILNEFKGCLK